MAAKVAMVAVPTVLGIASIRVYRVSDAPAGGLAPREELNVYNPLPKSAQVHFVPDTPGVTESVFTATRERVLPVVHAVKGACVSVKRGSVNLYHAGEDVFYYLKDPPPGFLPRFGTITMAGLLGMFLARKGSRLKRVSLPLGLMSAGASVCFPAQAVSVLKVAGKKVYAAAHWSSAAVSSLLTSKPQESLPQTQAAAVPHPEEEAPSAHSLSSEPGSTTAGSAQSAAVSQTPVESAAAISDEPVIAVITEEASVTLSESSGVQAPTETHQDPVAEPTPPTEEFPVSKETSDDISVETADPRPTASLEEAAGAEVPAPTSTQESTGPAVESVVSDPQPAAVQEERSPTHSPPPSEQPAVGSSKGGATFQPDPAHMDFGQSNPEDEDMYSTRS